MNRTALITGASSGIGKELARLFAADGHDVVLIARRVDKLNELKQELETKHGINVLVLQRDLSHVNAAEAIHRDLEERGVVVEFLINNAGFGTTGRFAELDLPRELEMIQVNLTSCVHLARLILPGMISRKNGRILNIGSTAGFQAGPYMAVYYASKAFVNSFSEALSLELRRTGVTVTLSCPGATVSEFAQRAGNIRSRLFRLGAMDTEQVARHAYRAMMRGDVIAIPGLKNKLGLQVLRVSPRFLVRRVTALLNT